MIVAVEKAVCSANNPEYENVADDFLKKICQ
jgi:hypothetical protein